MLHNFKKLNSSLIAKIPRNA